MSKTLLAKYGQTACHYLIRLFFFFDSYDHSEMDIGLNNSTGNQILANFLSFHMWR